MEITADKVKELRQRTGIGMMRPFCLANPGRKWQDKQDAYYLGTDLLVYPVMRPHLRQLRIEVPEGMWVGMFNELEYGPGAHRVDCPIGQPVVLYRRGSPFELIFQEVKNKL